MQEGGVDCGRINVVWFMYVHMASSFYLNCWDNNQPGCTLKGQVVKPQVLLPFLLPSACPVQVYLIGAIVTGMRASAAFLDISYAVSIDY